MKKWYAFLAKPRLPFTQSAKTVQTTNTDNKDKKYIWRNKMSDAYGICQTYQDSPLDLTHFLLVRTREDMLSRQFVASQMQNKKHRQAIRADLETGIQHLTKLFRIMDAEEQGEQPVAFAANSLYILARHGLA